MYASHSPSGESAAAIGCPGGGLTATRWPLALFSIMNCCWPTGPRSAGYTRSPGCMASGKGGAVGVACGVAAGDDAATPVEVGVALADGCAAAASGGRLGPPVGQ